MVPVYNLMISEGLPEFYANGILVHNCTWHEDLDWSPDRLDAMVWDAWHLKLAHTAPAGAGSIGSNAARKRIVIEPR
jgi:hypothetical protein